MELTPQDLGSERYLSLINRRITAMQAMASGRYQSGQTSSSAVLTPKRKQTRPPRRLVRYWTKDLRVSEKETEQLGEQIWQGPYGSAIKAFVIIFAIHMVVPLFMVMVGAPAVIPVVLSLFFALLWGSILTAMTVTPRQQLKAAHEKEVTTEDIENLLPYARGRLERMYLTLCLDVLRTEIPSPSAQSDIKAALRHLGDAIARLPADPVAVPNVDALRREAQKLRQEAAREPDSFIMASLQRQADTLEKRATLAAQSGRSARRAAALRREARAQMDALRAVLVGFQQSQPIDTMHISQLSSALHRVATEAQSAALARQELDNEELEKLYGGAVPPEIDPVETATPQPIPVPQVQTVTPAPSNGQAAPTPSAAQPGTASRPWWRNNGTPGSS